ncbi:MAG TPA: hypothetical protein VIK59_03025 [Verrucomicrobiae bacterium]
MMATDKKIPPHRRAKQLKITGIVILVLGISAAGILYWMRTRAADLSGDLSMAGYDKPETRQMEMLYGKSGEMMEDLSNELKKPGAQAIIVLAVSGIIAFGCFHFSHFDDDQPE